MGHPTGLKLYETKFDRTQGDIGKSTIIVGDCNTSATIERTTRQKISRV